MMKHFYILCVVTTLWAWFFLGGLSSNYYLDWKPIYQFLFVDAIPAAIMFYLAPGMIKFIDRRNVMRSALIIAFYFSVPFLIYDYIFLGIHKEYGLAYLSEFWFLSGFSVLPWLIFPAVALRMKNV